MNKYMLNEVVRIRPDLSENKLYENHPVMSGMMKCRGAEGRVLKYYSREGVNYYKVENGNDYWYSESMLEPVYVSAKPCIVPGLRPLWDTTEALHDLIALMSKYGITTYNIEQSEGLITFTFTKEV